MTKFKRLPARMRKMQICNAAKTVFLKKGFNQTTMEDIIEASGMSKGGVYNYYKNSSDILYDLMQQGLNYRYNQVNQYIIENSHLSKEEIIIEATLDKLLDYNEFKPLYAMLLLEKSNNPKLEKLYKKIYQHSNDSFNNYCQEAGLDDLMLFNNEALAALMNAIIIGTEILGERVVFEKNRHMLSVMIRAYFKDLKGVEYEQR